MKQTVEEAAREAIHKHYNCNGTYPCSEREYCEHCNGHNTAFDCCECGEDEFKEGFIAGAEWRINSVWHKTKDEVPQAHGEYKNEHYPQIPCLVYGKLSTGTGYGVRYWNVTEQCWDDEECDDYECSKDAIEKWAYLDDLIPNKKQ